MLLPIFWQSMTNSPIHFIANNPRTQKMITSYISAITKEIEKGEQQGRSTYKYFDLLEEITCKLITIHGFKAFAAVYGEDKGWIKTEIKNTLNFSFFFDKKETKNQVKINSLSSNSILTALATMMENGQTRNFRNIAG